MPAYKDKVTGKWFVKFYCKNWQGENKQIKKRGFETKRDALDYERNYKLRQEHNSWYWNLKSRRELKK